MLDLIVLFSLFIGLVAVLVAVHYWQTSNSTPSPSPAANKRLLNEWLQAHKVELPATQSILSVLNRQLQEIESEVCIAVVS